MKPDLNKGGKRRRRLSLIAAAAVLVLGMAGCAADSYRIDYCGAKDFYTNAKDSYRAGAEVELIYDLVATDTDYTFLLDGSTDGLEIQGTGSGFILRFTMPAHDVTLECISRNTMEYTP